MGQGIRRCLAIWLALVLALHGHALQAQSIDVPLAETDLLLLEVRLDQHSVVEALPSYQRGSELLLPLGELSRLLTIAIRSDSARGTATGFVLQESRTFHLDARQLRVVLNGDRQPVPPELVEIAEDDLYVAASLLEQWLPLELEPDLPSLRLKVNAREPLPLQLRLEREARAARLKPQAEPEGYALHPSPYRLLEVPLADLTLAAEGRRSPEGQALDSQYSLFATGDLLRMEGSLYAGRAVGQSDQVRATLGRTDPVAGLLGPLHATSFSLGNVVVPGLENIARTSPVGYGAAVSNQPLARPTSFDQHSLQGDLPPGWDVELYFNGALIGFQQSGPENRYEFNDLPLLYGVNEFRLVFHGPQGQVRVERSDFLLEDTLVPAGEFQYQVAAHHDDQGEPRGLLRLDYGLSRHLSMTAGAYSLVDDSATGRSYGFGGLRLALGPLLVNADHARERDGGVLSGLGLKTRLAGVSLALRRDEFQQFSSDYVAPAADPVVSRDFARLDAPLPWRVALALQMRRDTLASGADEQEAAGRISAFAARTSITAQYRWQANADAVNEEASLQASRRVAGTGLRGQVNYLLEPDAVLSSATASADRSLGTGYQLSAGVTRAFVDGLTQYSAGISKAFGEYALGVTAGYSTRDEASLALRLFMGFGRDPRGGDWLRSAAPMADSGALSARVFVDRNFNGRHDEGEAPVPNAEFLVEGARWPVRSDSEGEAYLARLTPRQFTDIAVDPATLEDPQWMPQPAGLRLLPRPGHAAVVDIPVIMTSEIDGTVYAVDRGIRRGIGGVPLELQNRRGEVVRRAVTASDGFYIVDSVPPGEYLLVSPDHIRRALRNDTGIRLLQVPANGDFVSGIDFVLLRRATPASAAPGRSPAQAHARTAGAKPSSPTAAPPVPPPGRHYVVQPGDWLWRLAERFYGQATTRAVQAIIAANPGVIPASGELQPGTRIEIPPANAVR